MALYSRTRSEISVPVVGSIKNYHNGVYHFVTVPCTMKSSSKVFQDNPTTGFAKKIADGEVIVTPCLLTVIERSVIGSGNVIQFQDSDPSNVYTANGDGSITQYYLARGAPDFPDTTLDIDTDTAVAKNNALSNIDKSPYGFAEDLGELGETLRFIRRPFFGMARLALKIKKKARYLFKLRASQYYKYSHALADAYLEYRFAFLPLCRSVHDALEASTTVVSRPSRATAYGKSSSHVEKTFLETVIPYQTLTYSGSKQSKFECVARLHYEISNPINDWKYKYGLRFKDIPQTLWELAPLSFMVDRVLNISKTIGGVVNLIDPNISILNGSVTKKSDDFSSIAIVSVGEAGYTSSVTPDTIVDHTFVMSRDVWVPSIVNLPLPGFTPKKLIQDASSIAELAALVYTRLT